MFVPKMLSEMTQFSIAYDNKKKFLTAEMLHWQLTDNRGCCDTSDRLERSWKLRLLIVTMGRVFTQWWCSACTPGKKQTTDM